MTAAPWAHPWVRGTISEQPFLIVAGTYRAGTTSLYTYLAGHPSICPSTIKEPAFFFSERWSETPPVYPPGKEVEAYLSLFKKKPQGRVLLEATPNYLHDPGCAQRINQALPDSKILVVLRDPVERLVSWYKHSVFQGRLAAGTDFEKWIAQQLADPRPEEQRPYMQRALLHGFYSRYLAPYYAAFGAGRVCVVWFDDLQATPAETMRSISRFAGIDPAFYDGYKFEVQNESVQFSRRRLYDAYQVACKALVASVGAFPALQFRVKKTVYSVAPALLRWLTKPADALEMSAATRRALHDYYRPDLEPLQGLVSTKIPWATAYQRR